MLNIKHTCKAVLCDGHGDDGHEVAFAVSEKLMEGEPGTKLVLLVYRVWCIITLTHNSKIKLD